MKSHPTKCRSWGLVYNWVYHVTSVDGGFMGSYSNWFWEGDQEISKWRKKWGHKKRLQSEDSWAELKSSKKHATKNTWGVSYGFLTRTWGFGTILPTLAQESGANLCAWHGGQVLEALFALLGMGLRETPGEWASRIYPLVNCYVTMENHHF